MSGPVLGVGYIVVTKQIGSLLSLHSCEVFIFFFLQEVFPDCTHDCLRCLLTDWWMALTWEPFALEHSASGMERIWEGQAGLKRLTWSPEPNWAGAPSLPDSCPWEHPGASVKLISEAAINMRPRAWLFPAREATKFQNISGRNGAPLRPASQGCKTILNESSAGEGEITCKEAAQPQVFSRRLKIAGLPPQTPSNTV